jgi:hypothetical protein
MGKELEYEIQLVTNGMVENYPKVVYMQTIRVKHIRDLIFASEQGDESYGKVLTSVLDSIINFDRTGFIKSSDELSMTDRQKLVIWQRLNSKGDKYSLPFECPECHEETENTFSIKDMDEVKLKNKVVEKTIKYFVNEDKEDFSKGNYYEFKLGLPTRKNYLKVKEWINDYKKEVFKKIDGLLYTSNVIELEEMKKRIKMDDNKLFIEQLKNKIETKVSVDEKEDIKEKQKSSKEEIEEINNKIILLKEKRLDNKEEIEKIVEKYQLKINLEDNNLTFESLFFDSFYEFLLSLGCCIKNDDITNYVELMMNLTYNIVADFEKYLKSCFHNIENKVIFRCSKCKYKTPKENLDFTADFFLR